MNIIFLANELNYTCGVTNHLLHLTHGLLEPGGFNIRIICGGGNGINRFGKHDIEIIQNKYFLHAGRSLPGYISAVKFLTGFVRKNKISILHSHNHYAANIAMRAAQFSEAVTIQTNHGLIKEQGKLKHFNARYYISINEHISEFITQNKISSEENTGFIRCGIPVPDTMPVKPGGTIRVIAASRFTPEKGLDTYIKAVSELSPAVKKKSEFLIAGSGELEHELKQLNQNLSAGVKFTGNITDMYDMLEKTHILVYPSRSDSEGFPAVITEAGACGNLVISSDFRGAGHVISGGVDGIIFNKNNHGKLKEILEEVILNFNDYNVHSEKFYGKIKDWFSLSEMIEKHIKFYNKCLEK